MTRGPILSRRHFVALGASALAAPVILRATRANAAGTLNFVTWGGSYRDSIVKGAIESFTAMTGVSVNIIDTPDLAKVKAQQMTGNIEWDVFDAPSALATSGSRQGYWAELDPAMFDMDDLALKPRADIAPHYIAAGGIAWNPNRFGEGQHPRNFRDYFDLETFPGRRTFRDRPSETLEAALLGDGVAPADLYPLDVDRAFAALDRIKPSVASWVAATPQTITLLQTNEVDYSYTYASRVRTSAAAGGEAMAFSFDQTLNDVGYLTVLKGAPNLENGMKFVQHCLSAEVQASTMELLSNIPVSLSARSKLSADAQKWLPNMENPNNVMLNDEWWADNFEAVTRKFKEWVLV